MKWFLYLPLCFLQTAGLNATESESFPSASNANAIVEAISKGADLSQTGLAELLYEEELEALNQLAGCVASPRMEAGKNLVIFDWNCNPKAGDNAGNENRHRTTTMRFRDDGSIFSLAINPLEGNFNPTEAGLEIQKWPSREMTVKMFANAVDEGGDITLGGTVPLTSLQQKQLQRFADSKWEIQKYMTEREKASARRLFGNKAKFAEAPKDGIELLFSSRKTSGPRDKMAIVYFDDENRVIGVHLENSMIATAAIRRAK